MADDGKKALFIVLVIIMFFIMLWVFQYVWNWVMPQVFGIKEITFTQAIAILFLASVLFSPVVMVNCKNSCDKE